jgi:ATP-binding cassette subfamily B protein
MGTIPPPFAVGLDPWSRARQVRRRPPEDDPRGRRLVLATASLHSTSEAAVQAALAEALSGRTGVVIARRLSTVRAADLILVLEDGRIVERGTHDELLLEAGRYQELYRTQFAEQPVVAEAAD